MEPHATAEHLPFLLDRAIAARTPFFDERHQAAFRLFNGFAEGCPTLVIDLYAATAVLYNHAKPPELGLPQVAVAQALLQQRFPWIHTIILKTRHTTSMPEQQGVLLAGSAPDQYIREHGVRYAVDLTMNRDASLYLDTRNLRRWAMEHLGGKTALNTFAYTGSLGVAAMAGGAARVVQLDLNRRFLNVAKTSYTLNGFPINKADFQTGDFWPAINRMKWGGERFDCVFVDPPIFAATAGGVVDLARNYTKVINKVRPLINDGGTLVAINNALFLSGRDYMAMLEAICADGYVRIGELIPVPDDYTGGPHASKIGQITDPAPFNHATKIAVLHIRRKRDSQNS
jgi:23S rRNA (cytosine1962-C5)-methyltransferase